METLTNEQIELIVQSIPVGKENALHLNVIAAEWNVSQTAAKAMIRQARMQGAKVCSSKSGYWIAANDEDIRAFLESHRIHALSCFKTEKALRHNLNEIKGQMYLNNDQIGGI